METVYCILVNYHAIAHTLECIQSVVSSENISVQIVVVDNASQEDCARTIHAVYPSVHVIENKQNVGFAAANNLGIRWALEQGAAYVLLLNNDTVMEPDCLTYFLTDAAVHPDCIITGKILNYYDRKKIWYGGGSLHPYKGDAVSFGFDEIDHGQCDQERICDFASGCCMLLSAATASQYALPEEYFLYYEDVDYCNQLSHHAVHVFYDPRAKIYHKESVSTNKNSPAYTYYFTRNRMLYISRNIHGLAKFFASGYSYLWFAKKVLTKKFRYADVICGIQDYKQGRTGKRQPKA